MRGLLLLLILVGFAGRAEATCQQDIQTIKRARAQAHEDGQVAAAGSNAAAGSASAAAGQNINSNSQLSSGTADTCSKIYQDGLARLSADEQKISGAKCQPQNQSEQAICNQCQSEKQKALKDVQALQGELSKGLGDCGMSKEGSDKTNQASQGGMPQMPQGGGEGGSDSPPTTDPLPTYQSTPTACSGAEAYNNPDCNDKYVADCASASSSSSESKRANCQVFTQRYCTPRSSGGTGEGVGSALCNKAVVEKFCQQEGRNQCPSCKQQVLQNASYCKERGNKCVSQSPEQQMEEAKSTCPTDPIFSNPSLAQAFKSGAGGAGGGGGGGGGGSSLGSGGSAGSPMATATADEEKKDGGKGPDLGVDGGGGGFSGYGQGGSGSGASDSSSSFGMPGGKSSARTPTAAPFSEVAGLGAAPGVMTKSLFTLSSETYKDHCQRGLLNNCGTK